MNVSEFVAKWRKTELTERSASQQHFLDLCEVFEHPTPAARPDPTGESFTFEKGAAKHGGGQGWADAWKRRDVNPTGCHAAASKGVGGNASRQFLRVLRQLRDLRRYSPVVIQNAQQVNLGNNQLNLTAR